MKPSSRTSGTPRWGPLRPPAPYSLFLHKVAAEKSWEAGMAGCWVWDRRLWGHIQQPNDARTLFRRRPALMGSKARPDDWVQGPRRGTPH
jgi:hypothetical protein